MEELWQQQAKQYVSLSSHGQWKLAKETSFNVMLSEPETIIAAVKNTLEEL